jgi:aminopeptidase N
VLARPETATDTDYQDIRTVIAHEYFHNWTGDRVTCRDWFQLSLKEGLTVFRDQQFTSDQGSAAVKRLRDVRRLRAAQFPEDDGPLAHPVRPDTYVKIDNFYTATVYQKGAEVVRMIRTLLGEENFRKGMDLYIARHDNHAVTIEDFVAAMQDASGIDLTEFMGWYSQAGTPELMADGVYDPQSRRYKLTMRQVTRPTPRQAEKKPLPIPLAMGLLDPSGRELPTRLAGERDTRTGTRILLFDKAEQDFVFEDVPAPPVPSLLRGFSAPVKLKGQKREWLRFLAAHDTDPFVRWDSGQQYATAILLDLIAARRQGKALELDAGLLEAMETTLDRAGDDPAFAAEALVLPGETFIADQMETVDVEAIHDARQFARTRIGQALGDKLRKTYGGYDDDGPYSPDGVSIGRRALRNACLAYLAAAGADGIALAKAQFDANRNMTDVLAALAVLSDADVPERRAALEDFHARWRHDDLVLDKWFVIQAASSLPGTIEAVRALYQHPDFDLRNPNRARSLIGAFAAGNQLHFHAASGEGYRFLADAVMALDPMNGQVAARMVTPLGRWRRQDEARQALMKQELARIQAMPGLSTGTREMVTRSLA